jgi:serine protease Do
MLSADREACPRCGETAALAATVCPFCKTSLLADVVLAAPVEDERIRYQLARAIAALDPPAPDFSTALQALADPRPVLARRISRLEARGFVESLADFGLAGTVEAAGTVAPPRASATRRILLGAALAILAVATTLLLATNHSALPVHRGAAQLTTISRARAIPWSSPRSSLSLKDLSALAEPSVVEIRCADRRSTGFFVARDVVLARFSETVGCSSTRVTIAGGRTLDGVTTKQDSRLGLALIGVAGSGAEPLRLGDASSLHSGDRIILLGAPGTGGEGLHEARLGIGVRLIHGLVHLPIEGDVRPDAAGGPVLDGQGYVVGVIASLEETAGEPFLLPVNYTFDESHLLERPIPGPDLQRWKALLAEVDLTEKLRVEPSQTPGATPSPESSPSIQ